MEVRETELVGNGHDDGIEIIENAGTDLVPVDGEISTQIATAKRFPRDVTKALKRALSMATLDEETAASCFYSLPRSGKQIAGPSARLAEIVASAWGNIRFGARVLGHDEKEIRAQGMCWDLENNAAFSVEVRRRITDKGGRTYNDDMVVVTGNAANSIAMRNAVLKIVPGVVWKKVYEAARKVAFGDTTTLAQRRQAAVEYFGKLGIQPDRVAAAVGKSTVENIGLEELETLTGLKTAIREGDTTVELAFPEPGSQHSPTGETARPRPQRVEQPQATAQAAEAPPEPAAPTPELPPEPELQGPPAAQPEAKQQNGDGEKPPMRLVTEIFSLFAAYNKKHGANAAHELLKRDYEVAAVSALRAYEAEEFLATLKEGLR